MSSPVDDVSDGRVGARGRRAARRPQQVLTAWDEMLAAYREDRVVTIGRAAVRLVDRVGPAGASMSALARSVGMSRANLYNYVPDVATAIRAYFTWQSEEFFTMVRAAVAEEPDTLAKLRRYIQEQVQYAAGHDHQAAMALMTGPNAVAVLGGPIPHPRSDILEDILAAGVADGTFRPGTTTMQAAMIHSVLHTAGRLTATSSLPAVVDAITDLTLHGVARRHGRARTQTTTTSQDNRKETNHVRHHQ